MEAEVLSASVELTGCMGVWVYGWLTERCLDTKKNRFNSDPRISVVVIEIDCTIRVFIIIRSFGTKLAILAHAVKSQNTGS